MSLQSEKKSANAVGAKTARACDSCLRRRARWYCAADDAFLCQGCDSSVHSANPLARRHERLRLKTASSSSSVPKPPDADIIMPSWHKGFKRKARTPRPHHHTKPTTLAAPSAAAGKTEPLVPDLETASFEETLEEEQLIYRVPVFYPVLAEFYTARTDSREEGFMSEDLKPAVQFQEFAATEVTAEIGGLPGFLPSDIDFAADVESLLGCGLDEDSFCMEGLGLLESRESPEAGCCLEGGGGQVKEEMDEEELAAGIALCHVDPEMELSRETLDLNFDCGTPTTGEDGHEEEVKVAAGAEMVNGYYGEVAAGRRRIALRLDYEGVIASWSTQGSPWADGERPQFNPDDCWPDYLGMWGCGDQMGVVYGGGGGGEMAGFGGGQVIGVGGGGDSGGREARVSRYREKRRTRLFSKKIRYEVRKLNAEKRPRMKGRFVKRVTSSFAGSGVAVAPLGVGSSSFTYR